MRNLILLGAALLFAGACAAAEPGKPEGYLSLDELASTAASGEEEAPRTVFEAKQGASLRDTLDSWARKAGWNPISWKLPQDLDFTLGVSGRYEGNFMAVTRAFVDSLGCEAELRILFNQSSRIAMVEPI